MGETSTGLVPPETAEGAVDEVATVEDCFTAGLGSIPARKQRGKNEKTSTPPSSNRNRHPQMVSAVFVVTHTGQNVQIYYYGHRK